MQITVLVFWWIFPKSLQRKIDMRSINSRTSKQEKATISISFEIGSKEELSSLVAKIRQVESVIDVERTTG